MAQRQLGHPDDDGKHDHVWYCKSFLDAARSKDIEIVGSTLLVAECTAVRDHHRAKILTDEVKAVFRALLMGGNPVVPIQPTPKILDRARDLSWADGFNFQSMDSIHLATAISHALFPAIRGDANNDQQALPVGVFAAQAGMDAVRPPVNIAG